MSDKDDSKASLARNLEKTPTWAVAGVCAAIIIISILLEKFLHKVGHWLTARHKRALYEALEKVKEELMLLGFISLTLVFTQDYISAICIPEHVANTMLPCKLSDESKGSKYTDYCKEKGKLALISIDGLHDIHILIFFLAVFHVIYSAATMALGRLKIRSFKKWEKETASNNYEFTTDTSRFRLTHETSFVRAHTRFWTKIPIFFYIGCFFRQFFRSVSKSDYLTLRNGFINVHLAPGSKFDFQKYIKRSLEDDYKTVVGVSPVLWASFVIFLLLNISGWETLFWASLIPLIIILIVGTKLQIILTKMALEITERHAVVQGIPLVQASDKHFWFNRPQLVLSLIHFVLFQNAFQVTYVLWVWYRYGIKSCFHDTLAVALGKIGLGLCVLILCSYITLPLYALIAQMGSSMKRSIFDEQTSKALKNWHMAAKKPHGGKSSHTLGNTSPTSSSMGSPFHPSRFQTASRSPQHDDHYASDVEDPSVPPPVTASLIRRAAEENKVEHDVLVDISPEAREHRNEDDFSFEKPAPGRGSK